MTEGTRVSFDFPPVRRRRIEARFSGGDITSDGGLLLLRQADRRPGLLESINTKLPDPRNGRYVRHDQLTLLRQRVYALCQGYDDLNDHDPLRGDLALQTATGQDQLLVSYLRPGKIDGARRAWAILALLVKRLRQTWPAVRIILRADSGFCRHRMLRWCERHGVIRAGSAFCCRVPFPVRISSTRPPGGWFQNGP